MSIYIARTNLTGRNRFYLRQSYQKDGRYYSRDVLDLGHDPRQLIVYPGGNAYYLHESIEDRLDAGRVPYDSDELDDIFWPFVKPRIQRAVGAFRHRRRHRTKAAGLSPSQQKALHLKAHIFDKRRIHYLKSGRPDQRGLGRMPAFMLKWLAGKSRDEIEQRFIALEAVLNLRELKTYVYVIFNLQHHFESVLSKTAPQALNPAEMDEHFVSEICRLNRSQAFWPQNEYLPWLHEYLRRYLFMYFDHEFPHMRSLDEQLRDFINRHRAYRPPPGRSIASDKAATILGVEEALLKKMTPRALTRLYRKLALKAHPDQGGDPERFVRLTEAYEAVLARLRDKKSKQN